MQPPNTSRCSSSSSSSMHGHITTSKFGKVLFFGHVREFNLIAIVCFLVLLFRVIIVLVPFEMPTNPSPLSTCQYGEKNRTRDLTVAHAPAERGLRGVLTYSASGSVPGGTAPIGGILLPSACTNVSFPFSPKLLKCKHAHRNCAFPPSASAIAVATFGVKSYIRTCVFVFNKQKASKIRFSILCVQPVHASMRIYIQYNKNKTKKEHSFQRNK